MKKRYPEERAKELLELVQSWRSILKNAPVPVEVQRLENAWTKLIRTYEDEFSQFYGGTFSRELVDEFSDSPFEALFVCIEFGFYPPPELLLALRTVWDEYQDMLLEGDRVTLEEAFIGKPPPKSGDYANRSSKNTIWVAAEIHFSNRINEGCTRMEAAESVVEFLKKIGENAIEPESVLKKFQQVKKKPKPRDCAVGGTRK